MTRKVKLFALPEKYRTKFSSPSSGKETNDIVQLYLRVGKVDEF